MPAIRPIGATGKQRVMPWNGPRGPSETQKCVSCLARYWQSSRTRLCRQCEREQADVAMLSYAGSEARRIRADALKRMAALAEPPPPLRELEIDGHTFIVVWDGSFK